jgi:hypothetical protein
MWFQSKSSGSYWDHQVKVPKVNMAISGSQWAYHKCQLEELASVWGDYIMFRPRKARKLVQPPLKHNAGNKPTEANLIRTPNVM